jgi:chromosome segregation ATPase
MSQRGQSEEDSGEPDVPDEVSGSAGDDAEFPDGDAGDAGGPPDDVLPPEHELFDGIQIILGKQLDEMYDTVDVAIRNKQAERLSLTTDRENIGVELYAIQQTLAKLQQRLTNANEQKASAEQERIQLEEEVREARKMLSENEADLKTRTKEYERNRLSLDQLNDVVLRLERHNQETANEVAVVRRQTYKSEQAASETEVAKREQDYYIDRLTNQIQGITANLSTLEAQILAQRGETKTARDALLQASLEMEKINFERNHLIQDWNSSLISVKRRSETLMAIESAAAKQEEDIRALQNESSGLASQIRQQQDVAERNHGLLSKIDARIRALDGKIEEARNYRQTLETQLEQLCQLTRDKEAEVSRLLIERNQATSEFNQSSKGANEVSNRVHELEDAILRHMTEQSDLKRDAVQAQNVVQKVRDQIASKDRELSDLQNEVVRLRIDKLNIAGQSEKLDRGLKEIVEELHQKENLINQYEMQILRNNADIGKRQNEVDRLNRLYESLTSAQNGEDCGPLERKIRALEARIDQTDATCQESQATWLKKQTELVSLTHACEKIEEGNTRTSAHIGVLTRKRDRTRNLLQATEKEIERLQIQIRALQREMSTLGAKLSAHTGSSGVLVEGNIQFEAEILEALQNKEAEAAATESKVEELAELREQLADELMETEKAIMLCEKKLQLAKEMREALDPNYGAAELQAMRKEISRMELRLKQIKKQQQTILQEMEFALKRRETIATRGAVQKRLNKDKTRADLAKGITEVKREIKRIKEEAAKHEGIMQANIAAQREIGQDIEQLAIVQRGLQAQRIELEKTFEAEDRAKAQGQVRLERLHTKTRLLQGTVGKTKVKSPEGYEQTMGGLKEQERHLNELLDLLHGDFPHLKGNFQSVREKIFTT